MIPTPRLYTAECSAHYPRLYSLAEALTHTRTVRKYPIILDTFAFAHDFENWTQIVAEEIESVTQIRAPYRLYEWDKYGADPIVADRLDYLANHITDYVQLQPELGVHILQDLLNWRSMIVMRSGLPKYLSSKRCKDCGEYAVMKYADGYFCANKECQYSWIAN